MNDLHDRMAPLRAEQPTDADIAAVLAARRRPKPRRRKRLAIGLVAATAAAAAAIAALPGGGPASDDPVALLRTAAAVAGDQPPAFVGYRYTEVLEHWRWASPAGRPPDEVTQRVENWVDRAWKGKVVAHPGKVISGRPPDFWVEADEREFVYGDGPLLDLDITALPTEPRELLAALDANNRSQNWAPGLPTPVQARYDVTRSVLLLLGTANTTPALRAGLWGVLALLPGLTAETGVRDPLGRDGDAVRFTLRRMERTPPERFTVIFDPRSSELLSWSVGADELGTPALTQTFIRAGHVREAGRRP